MPGRSASTDAAPSGCGSDVPTALRCRAFSGAPRLRRSCGHIPERLPPAPKGAILAANGKLPPPLQRFGADSIGGIGGGNSARVRIMFPPHGARLELASGDGRPEPVALKIAGGVEPMTIMVNGVPQDRGSGRTIFFDPQGPGFVRLTVVDGKGTADSVMVRLQ